MPAQSDDDRRANLRTDSAPLKTEAGDGLEKNQRAVAKRYHHYKDKTNCTSAL